MRLIDELRQAGKQLTAADKEKIAAKIGKSYRTVDKYCNGYEGDTETALAISKQALLIIDAKQKKIAQVSERLKIREMDADELLEYMETQTNPALLAEAKKQYDLINK